VAKDGVKSMIEKCFGPNVEQTDVTMVTEELSESHTKCLNEILKEVIRQVASYFKIKDSG
jgi:hypothetical protein